MSNESYASVIGEYRQSIILIGCIVFVVCIVVGLIVEFYVRNGLGLKFLHFGKLKFSPTWFVVAIMLVSTIYTAVVVKKCDLDVKTGSYITYEGEITYESRTITLHGINMKVRVSSGYDIVPYGKSYGKCVFSFNSKIIVDYDEINNS